jgi:4'-phosphopantetheinyl transferase EntD
VLPEEERPALARAVEKRRREFIAGRVLFRQALAALGQAPLSLPQGTDRAPVWPEGWVGSITHTRAFCAVAVAPSNAFLGVGIDAEDEAPLKEDLWPRILTAPELAALSTLPATEQGTFAKFVFSAKEAAYKAQYAITRTFLGFDAMEVHRDPATSSFTATLTRDVGSHFAKGHVFRGRARAGNGHWLAAVTIARGRA